MSGEDNKAVHLHCKAHKNTWSHQRRKKRLLQRLKSKELQAQPGTSLALQACINITLTNTLHKFCVVWLQIQVTEVFSQ